MSNSLPLVFLNRTYDDAFTLTLEARHYLERGAEAEARDLLPLGRLIVTREITRLTARLTSVMAWCLTLRAVQAGEIEAAALAEERSRLTGKSVCFAEATPDTAEMPKRLGDLLARSRNLYLRVSRLDSLIAQQG